MRIVVSQAAQADLQRLHKFLSGPDPDAARRAIASIVSAIDSLDPFPERGRPSPLAGIRELLVPFGASAYVVRYAHESARDELVILRVWHNRESRE